MGTFHKKRNYSYWILGIIQSYDCENLNVCQYFFATSLLTINLQLTL